MRKPDTSRTGKSWDTYWHGAGDIGAFSSGGVNHPAIGAFWSDLFALVKTEYDSPRIVDIATGNGAVVEMAIEVLGNIESAYTCIDVSDAAIENVLLRFPGSTGIVADAAAVPLDDEQFDIATSQFGVEYAGIEAVAEAARLVAPGGRLALMLHNRNGSIDKECSDSLTAIEKFQASQFVPLAIELFKTGFAAVRGADRGPYDVAGKALAPAIHSAESIMNEFGEHVAGDTIARLYSDVGNIHSKMQNYDPDEVLGWLDTMDSELNANAGRMSSMIKAAIAQPSFDQLCADLRVAGFTLERAEPLTAEDQELPLAWVLVAIR